jgi:hypothetical protein
METCRTASATPAGSSGSRIEWIVERDVDGPAARIAGYERRCARATTTMDHYQIRKNSWLHTQVRQALDWDRSLSF